MKIDLIFLSDTFIASGLARNQSTQSLQEITEDIFVNVLLFFIKVHISEFVFLNLICISGTSCWGAEYTQALTKSDIVDSYKTLVYHPSDGSFIYISSPPGNRLERLET